MAESWLERAARAHPDRPAVNTMSYAELLARARDRARTITPGDQVPIVLPPGEAFAVELHACLLAGAVALPGTERDGAPAPATAPAGPAPAGAVAVRTSGTTGTPREVLLTVSNWLWSALGSAVALGHRDDERWLCALPLTHVGGLSILIRSAIFGTTAIVHERWDTARVLTALRDPRGPTIVSLVPTTLGRLLDAGLERPPALRTALLGGAPIPAGLLDRAREAGVHVTPTYGLTEACSQVATDGVPLFCTSVELAADGEVIVGGPTVAGGGPLHSGDLGRWNDRGRLEIIGRKSDTIITGGENVVPAEVERVLESHPAVIEAAVAGEPDREWGERLVALVRLRAGAADAALAAHCRERLAAHAVPKRFVRVDEPLPRTGSGKLLRRSIDLDGR